MGSSNNLPPTVEASLARKLKQIQSDRTVNRRNFMAGLGIVGIAATGSALLTGCSDGNGQITDVIAAGSSQNDVLNFALNLEYLEATFYSYITTGNDISTSLTGSGPAPTGTPSQITFPSSVITDVINEIAFDEISNLRTVLGSNAIARPALALNAMGSVTAANVFNMARSFEDVGVTAYAGSAASLTGTNLTYAAQILAVEGFHASILRYLYITTGGTGATALDSGHGSPRSRWTDPGHRRLLRHGRHGQRQHGPRLLPWLRLHPNHLSGARDRLQHPRCHRHNQGRLLPQRRQRQHYDYLTRARRSIHPRGIRFHNRCPWFGSGLIRSLHAPCQSLPVNRRRRPSSFPSTTCGWRKAPHPPCKLELSSFPNGRSRS